MIPSWYFLILHGVSLWLLFANFSIYALWLYIWISWFIQTIFVQLAILFLQSFILKNILSFKFMHFAVNCCHFFLNFCITDNISVVANVSMSEELKNKVTFCFSLLLLLIRVFLYPSCIDRKICSFSVWKETKCKTSATFNDIFWRCTAGACRIIRGKGYRKSWLASLLTQITLSECDWI